MTALPAVRGASAAIYPFTQTYIAQTGIQAGQNGRTTRWVKSPPLVRFELPYARFIQSEKNALLAAFSAAKGQFSTDRSITTDTTYTNLAFDDDEYSAAEQQSTRYSSRFVLTQTLAQNLSPGTSGAAYPVLDTGAIGKLTYTQKRRYQTIASKMESGPRYTFAEFSGGLTGFPTGGLMAWEFDERGLTDTEVTAKVSHWLANWGNCFPFGFTDEDGAAYTKVYYATPELSITRTAPNQANIRTGLIQTY